MGRAYSQDLRERVMAAVDSGTGAYAVPSIFRVCVSYIYKVLGPRTKPGKTGARPWAGGPKPKLAAHDEALRARIMSEPDATLALLQAWLVVEHSVKVSIGCLYRLEAEARKENEVALKDYEREVTLAKIHKEEAVKAARKSIKNSVTANIDVVEPDAPLARRYLTHDSTYESLGEILASNPHGVLVYRDELVSLLKTLDREEFCAARGFYLSAWNGVNGHTFDRIIRGKTNIEHACISLLGSTQPGRLAEYISRANHGGAGDDGLLQRFGLLVWLDQSGDWREVDCYPDGAAKSAAWDAFTRLDGLTPEAVCTQRDDYDNIPYSRFDDAAQEIFSGWRADFEKRFAKRGDAARTRKPLGKIPQVSPRFGAHLDRLA
jgi:transposase